MNTLGAYFGLYPIDLWKALLRLSKGYRIYKIVDFYIPLSNSVEYVFSTFNQNFDFKIRRDHQKIFYDRHAYESVDVRSLFLGHIL